MSALPSLNNGYSGAWVPPDPLSLCRRRFFEFHDSVADRLQFLFEVFGFAFQHLEFPGWCEIGKKSALRSKTPPVTESSTESPASSHSAAETTAATHAKSPGGRRARKASRPAESPTAAGHRTGAHWSCPIESWHNIPPLTMLVIRFDPVFQIPGPGRHYRLPWPFPKFRPALCLCPYRHLFRVRTGRRDLRCCVCIYPCPSRIRTLDPEALFHLLLA